jgi:hypothetical protein
MWFSILIALFLSPLGVTSSTPPCRFAPLYNAQSILSDPASFEATLLSYEGLFHQHNVSYNAVNGMTFDGTLLSTTTGVHRVEGLHAFSAASKESLHFMALANVIAAHEGAVRWILASENGTHLGLGIGQTMTQKHFDRARQIALQVLGRKWQSYTLFNQTFPGFGGFLPWFVWLFFYFILFIFSRLACCTSLCIRAISRV